MKQLALRLYASVDAMRMDEFVAGLAPDVEVVVGNNPAMNGRQAVKDGIGYFWSTIQGLKHNFVNVVESRGLTFLEAKVDYRRKDGRQVTVPVVTVLERNGDLVKSMRIYFDVSPVYGSSGRTTSCRWKQRFTSLTAGRQRGPNSPRSSIGCASYAQRSRRGPSRPQRPNGCPPKPWRRCAMPMYFASCSRTLRWLRVRPSGARSDRLRTGTRLRQHRLVRDAGGLFRLDDGLLSARGAAGGMGQSGQSPRRVVRAPRPKSKRSTADTKFPAVGPGLVASTAPPG